jgi:hypothetical protein
MNFFFLQFIFCFYKKKKKKICTVASHSAASRLRHYRENTIQPPSTSHLTDKSSTVNQNIRSHPSHGASSVFLSASCFDGFLHQRFTNVESHHSQLGWIFSVAVLIPAFQAPTSIVLSGVDLWQTLASTGHYLSNSHRHCSRAFSDLPRSSATASTMPSFSPTPTPSPSGELSTAVTRRSSVCMSISAPAVSAVQ